ncbi:MAG TPA: chemotaxis protein CheW [Candidatus Acidoferrales bacterium]|nr:chemotaxis protein CheW [Candidatus Acidoferrales bacterium]
MRVTENERENSFVLLQIGAQRVALPAGLVAELAPPVRLHAFPHSSKLISGVIVRRGRIVPVYEAALVLGGRSSSSQRFYLIARWQVGNASELGAIPVNGECELASGEMQPAAMGRPAYVAGTLAVGDDSFDVLNLDAFTASHATAAGESLGAEAQS